MEKTLKEEAKITKIKRLQKNKKRTLKRKKGEAAESYPGDRLPPFQIFLISSLSQPLGAATPHNKKKQIKARSRSSSSLPVTFFRPLSPSPLIFAMSASKPKPWTTLACDPPYSEDLLSLKEPWFLFGKAQALIGYRGHENFYSGRNQYRQD